MRGELWINSTDDEVPPLAIPRSLPRTIDAPCRGNLPRTLTGAAQSRSVVRTSQHNPASWGLREIKSVVVLKMATLGGPMGAQGGARGRDCFIDNWVH